MSIGYCGTQDVINILGGTQRISVGSGGTNDTSTTIIDYMITRAENVIDYKLQGIYGTQGFGTSSSGTRGVPGIVKDVCADYAGYLVISSITNPLRTEIFNYGTILEARAVNMIKSLASGENTLLGYQVGTSGLPMASGLVVNIYDDVVTMSGTEMQTLQYYKILKNSDRVHITTLDGTTAYTKDTDYKIYYWDDPTSGTNYGRIRRLAGGSITDGQQVAVDYKIWKDSEYYINDQKLYGLI